MPVGGTLNTTRPCGAVGQTARIVARRVYNSCLTLPPSSMTLHRSGRSSIVRITASRTLRRQIRRGHGETHGCYVLLLDDRSNNKQKAPVRIYLPSGWHLTTHSTLLMVLLCSDKTAHRMSRSGLYSRSPSRCRKESPHPRRRCTGSRHRKRYSRRSRLSGANIDTVTAGWDWDILVIHPSAHGQLGVGRQALIRDRFNRTSKRKSLWITPMCSWMSNMTRT